jgi:hypothetical protein
MLKYKGQHSFLYNVKTGTVPIVIHGNGPIKVCIDTDKLISKSLLRFERMIKLLVLYVGRSLSGYSREIRNLIGELCML